MVVTEPTQTNTAGGFTKALQTAKHPEWRKSLQTEKLFGELITACRYRFLCFENQGPLQIQILWFSQLVFDAVKERFCALREP